MMILKAVLNSEESGYSLMKKIRETTDCWKPSTGSIYPLLEQMAKEAVLTTRKEGQKKLYRITSKGKHELKSAIKEDEINMRTVEHLKVFESLCAGKEAKAILRRAIMEMEKL